MFFIAFLQGHSEEKGYSYMVTLVSIHLSWDFFKVARFTLKGDPAAAAGKVGEFRLLQGVPKPQNVRKQMFDHQPPLSVYTLSR